MEYLPPYSKEAEIAVLGSMLMDANAVSVALQKLEDTDFLSKQHQEIFFAMRALEQDDKPVDLLLLHDQLEKNGSLEGVGGDRFLATLAQAVPTSANVEEYIAIVKQKATLRSLAGIGGNISKDAGLETKDPDTVLEEAEQALFRLAQQKGASSLQPIQDIMGATLESIEAATLNKGSIRGFGTGFSELDHVLSGLVGNQLIVLAGRPGMGKTSFALNIASNVALKEKLTVAIFSLEMTGVQLATRMVCSDANVDSQRAIGGTLSDDEMQKVFESISRIGNTQLFIDETSGINIPGIRSKCRKLKKTNGLDMIVIDYLQLIQTPARSENRQQAISEMTRSLKNLAKDLEVPILLLSQLSREPEKMGRSHRPQLSHLRESGAIEQDADVVLFLYREKNEESEGGVEDTTTELIVAKNRNGPTAIIHLGWMGEFTKYISIDRYREE